MEIAFKQEEKSQDTMNLNVYLPRVREGQRCVDQRVNSNEVATTVNDVEEEEKR